MSPTELLDNLIVFNRSNASECDASKVEQFISMLWVQLVSANTLTINDIHLELCIAVDGIEQGGVNCELLDLKLSEFSGSICE